MTSAKFCPQCGAALLPDSSNGICPRCAFKVAMYGDGQRGTDPTIAAEARGEGRFVPPKPNQLAQHFPQLEILDLIGQGGMGAVYKARQRGLDRIVALKILPPDLARDPAFEERFSREARALAKLSHPNIVAVYDSGQAGGLFYFIMEYVDGVNLRQAIQSGQLAAKQALAIVPQVCDALQYAHDEGIVHRDIKPENVLIDTKGRVRIADFGLARLLGKTPENFTLTAAHQVLGTPRYMAPEQLEGTREVDHRADIYSLGVVFYEMLTGELPLGRFAPPSKKVQVDVRLDEVVLRTLEKEPDLRYQQAGEIKTAVQTIVSPTTMPRHVQQMYGREYRSKTTILGLPLVHIATGIDPITHHRRIAKGIIAIGDTAIGLLALGGGACGLIAIGGVAVGGFTVGGLSLGLAFALGGGAVGCGVAFGGFALAPIAVGGCAIGFYAAGGAGFAIHPFAANARDPAGEAFFRNSGSLLLRILALLSTATMIIPFVALLAAFGHIIVNVIRHSMEESPRNQPFAPPTDDRSRPSGHGIGVGILIVAVLGVIALVPIGLWVFARLAVSREAVLVQQVRADAARAALKQAGLEARRVIPSRHENLNWTDDGPSISDQLQQIMSLDNALSDQIDRVLSEIHQAYLTIERNHSTREVVAAHQKTTVHVPTAEISQLQQQLWNQLDVLLNPRQQETMRQLLPVTPLSRMAAKPGDTMNDFVLPGVLGWGDSPTQIDLFQGGEWFEWQIESQGERSQGSMRGLDPRWQRFWVAEPKQK